MFAPEPSETVSDPGDSGSVAATPPAFSHAETALCAILAAAEQAGACLMAVSAVRARGAEAQNFPAANLFNVALAAPRDITIKDFSNVLVTAGNAELGGRLLATQASASGNITSVVMGKQVLATVSRLPSAPAGTARVDGAGTVPVRGRACRGHVHCITCPSAEWLRASILERGGTKLRSTMEHWLGNPHDQQDEGQEGEKEGQHEEGKDGAVPQPPFLTPQALSRSLPAAPAPPSFRDLVVGSRRSTGPAPPGTSFPAPVAVPTSAPATTSTLCPASKPWVPARPPSETFFELVPSIHAAFSEYFERLLKLPSLIDVAPSFLVHSWCVSWPEVAAVHAAAYMLRAQSPHTPALQCYMLACSAAPSHTLRFREVLLLPLLTKGFMWDAMLTQQ